ncbi:DUF934 domain-containing protein [Marinobacter salinexigens]|uniref:DUF934 domain-containing protein n=1 Tax=Marinobacter salinexigens TaxID=2919747 RepID=A0A5B0V9Z0_9GAMM|nr:DUF934 domain-containing protein [Marinobacter salinexigens]KAA1170985.1 DUF934 domain-containing protein [Marinobacter salinexigens]
MNNIIGLVNGGGVYLADDQWTFVDDEVWVTKSRPMILPLDQWQKLDESGTGVRSIHGVWLGPDDDPAVLGPISGELPIIALQFPSFRDGRAYSQANLLRTRYGFKGDLRAIGDVLRDQLALMRHCGFTSFAIRADKCVSDALKGFDGYDMIYARSATTPEPLYRRYNRGHQLATPTEEER